VGGGTASTEVVEGDLSRVQIQIKKGIY